MSDRPHPCVGRPFHGGIIVSTSGRKWGVVEMPDGRRVVHDVSRVIAAAAAEGPEPPPSRRRLLGLATSDDLSDEAGIEAFTQLLLERLMEAHRDSRQRHSGPVPEEHDGLA